MTFYKCWDRSGYRDLDTGGVSGDTFLSCIPYEQPVAEAGKKI